MSGLIEFANDTNKAKRLSQQFKQGKLRKIYHGVYTSDLTGDIDAIVKKYWMEIVRHIVQQGILSFRTAHDLKPSNFKVGQTIVFITSSYNKTITLPGLIIKVIKGNKDLFIEQILPGLARSNEARMLLENLTTTKSTIKNIKTIGQEGVEKYLAKELRYRHETRLNEIRDAAKIVAVQLDMHKEFDLLNKIISGLLKTNHDPDFLQIPYAKSMAKKEPYDERRLKSFQDLSVYLQKNKFEPRPYNYQANSFKNLTFFESYFSNYIEGTIFVLDEAETIIFTNKEIYNRHSDSHDILANFRLSSDHLEMIKTPNTPEELLEILQARHAYLMHERPEVRPGLFKERHNRAGSTHFVAPIDVIGTLTNAFALYEILPAGMPRALFMHFLISEVHPFEDGNGRLARIMMNAELVKNGSYKIIMPTVYRDGYIQSLRIASRDHNFDTYCKVMDVTQAYTYSISWDNYQAAKEKIEGDLANLEPDEGLTTFNAAIRKLKLSDFSS